MKVVVFVVTLFVCVFAASEAKTSENDDTEWAPDPICPYPSDDLVYFNDPSDCSQYYECYQGNKYVMTCPSNLVWNEEMSYCDYRENVDCKNAPGAATTEAWTPDPLCPYPSDDVFFFRYPLDCSKYWECYEGNKYLKDCPSNLFWNTEHNYCDYRENVDCDSTNGPTTKPPATIPQTTADGNVTAWTPDPMCPYPSDEIFYFLYPYNCSQYWECYQGKKYLMSCPTNLYWNVKYNYCDYRENVDCYEDGNSTTTTTIVIPTAPNAPTTIDPAAGLCDGKPVGTLFPDLTNCSKYYECDGEKAVSFTCPGDLYWNQKASTCDYQSQVNCTVNPINNIFLRLL